MKFIERPTYMNDIKPFMYKNLIKVIVGQRRVGKSVLLSQIRDFVLKEKPGSNVVYINKEDLSFEHIKTYLDLVNYSEAKTKKRKPNFLFVDEIQDIEQFEKALRHIQSKHNWDIYITGSNANILSGELSSFLSGRYVEIKVYTLSYLEFFTFHNLIDNNETLKKFLRFGGLPYLMNLELVDQIVFDYLKNIYAAILYKDIIARHNIRNVGFLDRLVYFISDNTGSIVSAKSINEFLKSQKISISNNVILDYLGYLCEAFFLFKVKRHDIKGKKILEIGEKYYFEDLGIRHAIGGYRDEDINKIIENVVYLQLIQKGYHVTIGKLGEKEIDFIAEKPDERIYIQVAFSIPDEAVKQREFGNLLAIPDNFRKIVITLDEFQVKSYQGVEHFHLRKFLTEFPEK